MSYGIFIKQKRDFDAKWPDLHQANLKMCPRVVHTHTYCWFLTQVSSSKSIVRDLCGPSMSLKVKSYGGKLKARFPL